MALFVAFLRGINVGGRVVVKQTLIDAFDDLGFVRVSTFKQSGNVIFESSESDLQNLTAKIEEKLQSALGYSVKVFIRTVERLKEIIEQDTFKNQPIKETSFLVTFLPNIQAPMLFDLPLTIPKSTAQIIGKTNTEAFSVTHGGGEGALPNPFLETKLKIKATTRNLNVIRGIVEKYD
jgi:uncharacterized protein (DUF1697 family)